MDTIRTSQDEKVWRTDWLGTTPVFYNTHTGCVNSSIHAVIENESLELDPEGLETFLSFGYCALGLTPVKNVRFLPPCSELRRVDGRFDVRALPDPACILLEDLPPTDERDVLDMIRARVQDWEAKTNGPIVLPTSGGFDSRLLTLCVRDRRRIRAFTYGPSRRQSGSREVVVACHLSETLGISWDHVELQRIHTHMDAWHNLFGCATHAHGMYQMAFYHAVRERVGNATALLSGIIGDVWAGNWMCPPVRTASEVNRLGRSYGMNADTRYCRFKTQQERKKDYMTQNQGLLASATGRIVLAARFKMMLLRYLLEIPASFGFRPWSPFLDPDVALAMLRLPAERRKDRLWQREFFQREGVDMETMELGGSYEIALNRAAVDAVPLAPLSARLLAVCMATGYVRWINRRVCGSLSSRFYDAVLRTRNGLLDVPYLNAMLYRIGMRERNSNFDAAYGAYMTLWPLQKLISEKGRA